MQKQISVEYAPGRFALYRADYSLQYIASAANAASDCNLYYRNPAYVRPIDRETFERERAAWAAVPRLEYAPAEPDCVIQIPFAGFYESKWDGLLDHESESWANYEAERESDPDADNFEPLECLRISESEYNESVWHCAQWSGAHLSIAQDYLSEWDDKAGELLESVIPGFALGLRFESLSSPREYNFSTDRLFAYIPAQVLAQLFAYSESAYHAPLAYYIRKRFTSYDGFHSFYSNRLSEWLETPLEHWDHNQTGTLLLAVIAQAAAAQRETAREWHDATEWAIYESLSESAHSYFDSAMDWAALEKWRDEKREEKRAAAIESGELPADGSGEPAPYRCPYTLDLFAQESR